MSILESRHPISKGPIKYMAEFILIKLMGTFQKNSECLFKRYLLGILVSSFEMNTGVLFKKYPLGTLVGTFSKNSPHTRWITTGRIVSKLTMNSQCTHWVSDPLPPVRATCKDIGQIRTPLLHRCILSTRSPSSLPWWRLPLLKVGLTGRRYPLDGPTRSGGEWAIGMNTGVPTQRQPNVTGICVGMDLPER